MFVAVDSELFDALTVELVSLGAGQAGANGARVRQGTPLQGWNLEKWLYQLATAWIKRDIYVHTFALHASDYLDVDHLSNVVSRCLRICDFLLMIGKVVDGDVDPLGDLGQWLGQVEDPSPDVVD